MALWFRALLVTVFCSLTAHAQDAPQYPFYNETLINDFADLLTDEQEEIVRSQLHALKENQDIEMTLVTISSRYDYGRSGSIEGFATGLFNEWGIGNARRNDGVMVLVAKGDRDMRIELGSGYSWERDADMKHIIDTAFLPDFRNEAYDTGILKGMAATITEVSARPAGTGAVTEHAIAAANEHAEGMAELYYLLRQAFIFLVLLPISLLYLLPKSIVVVPRLIKGAGAWRRKIVRNRRRSCPSCAHKPMTLLNEEEDNQYLSDAEQFEEMMNSVDYDIWNCRACNHLTIKRHVSLTSKLGACPSCNHRLLEAERMYSLLPSYTSSGKYRIDYECMNCDYTNTEYETIPRKHRASSSYSSSSSSSSSSGSFGGGSSSGGGASGSW